MGWIHRKVTASYQGWMVYESHGYYSKLPQTPGRGLLETTAMFSLSALEARGLESRCGQGILPSEDTSLPFPVAPGILGLVGVSLQSVPLSSGGLSSVCVISFSFLLRNLAFDLVPPYSSMPSS